MRILSAVRAAWAALAVAVVAPIAGCGGSGDSGGLTGPKVAPARTFKLNQVEPSGPVKAGQPTTIKFSIQQPDGRPLTRFKTGSGPHTGVHLIIVRKDLSTIIHRHPPIAPDGTITQKVTFPKPGPYRVLVDVYPKLGPNFQQNFQLFGNVAVSGAYNPTPLPAFKGKDTIAGDHFTMTVPSKVRSLRPEFLKVKITSPSGGPVS